MSKRFSLALVASGVAAIVASVGASLVTTGAPFGVAAANPYESFISIETEDDLYDLQAAQAITDDTFNQLLDLLARGVDLNTADRDTLYELPNLTYEDVDAIIAFRKLQGRVRDPADLAAANVISTEKLYSIAAFLLVSDAKDNPLNAHGFVRLLSRVSSKDRHFPATTLRARASALSHWTAGIGLVATRLRVRNVEWDNARQALVADGPALRPQLAKLYARYKDDNFDAIAGTYRLGFGQRLTFDNTLAYNPNGIYHDDQIFFDSDLTRSCKESAGELPAAPCDFIADPYITPDFRWRDGLLGVAGGAKKLPLAQGWMQLYGWGSYSLKDIYQYELVDRAICADPNNDDDDNCQAPQVFRRPDGALSSPTSRFSFQTLPNIFGEMLAGVNASYFVERRKHIGITGYGAYEQNLVGGKLDLQEYSRIPTGRKFGAVGLNFAFGKDWLDVFGEVAMSYDQSPNPDGLVSGGGGPAAILRATATTKGQELEASLRYYDVNFVNPYARPLAAPDELNGQRARDEIGGRLRHSFTNKRFSVRSYLDFWYARITQAPNIDSWVRADVRANREWSWGAWLRFRDKDIANAGHDECFEVSTETDELGEPVPCQGMQITSIARVGYTPNKVFDATVQLQHRMVDDVAKYPDKFRQDLSAWFIALIKPTPDVRIRLRGRYLNESVDNDLYLEESASLYADTSLKLRGRDVLRVRLDAKFYLDGRESTMNRTPNPELGLWLGYELRY